jgi:hypothetical protein
MVYLDAREVSADWSVQGLPLELAFMPAQEFGQLAHCGYAIPSYEEQASLPLVCVDQVA